MCTSPPAPPPHRASGASGYAGTSPDTAGKFSQKAYAAYVGLETDLTEALTVGAAGRYEHYNTFGDAWVGKVNALYKFADAFSIRGSFGTGFHAPSPGQSNVSIVTAVRSTMAWRSRAAPIRSIVQSHNFMKPNR